MPLCDTIIYTSVIVKCPFMAGFSNSLGYQRAFSSDSYYAFFWAGIRRWEARMSLEKSRFVSQL